MKERIRRIIDDCKRDNPCEAEIRYDEPMSAHTTFKTGGPADCWVRPVGDGFPAFAAALMRSARIEDVPVFILGGGANVVIADKGIRGMVIDTGGWAGAIENDAPHGGAGEAGSAAPVVQIRFRSGTALDDAAETAASRGLSGLEFVAGMPGSIGGAVWMNARCYDREIADALIETETIEFSETGFRRMSLSMNRADFGYKRSPFQSRGDLILSAVFSLAPGDPAQIRGRMESHRLDRQAKGHYRYPSAGSAFKNSRSFGKPTGQIIDELGLRGLRIGGAQVAPFHGNIIVNTGSATAADIRALSAEVAARVKSALGLALEPEILFVGDWE